MKQVNEVVVLDTRSILAFGGGHIPDALNIALLPEFPTWIGWMVDRRKTHPAHCGKRSRLALAGEHLFRVGYDSVVGYLHQGMTSWQNAALPLAHTGEWTVHTLNEHLTDADLTILDVRSEQERKAGFVPNSIHQYVAHLRENLPDVDQDKPHCRSTVGRVFGRPLPPAFCNSTGLPTLSIYPAPGRPGRRPNSPWRNHE